MFGSMDDDISKYAEREEFKRLVAIEAFASIDPENNKIVEPSAPIADESANPVFETESQADV